MSLTTKILLSLWALTTFLFIGFIVYQQYQFNKGAEQIQNSLIEQKQLMGNIIRSQSQYVNKTDFDNFARDNKVNLDSIQKDLNSLGGKIDSINSVIFSSTGQNATGVSSSGTSPSPNPSSPDTIDCNGKTINCLKDPNGYFKNVQNLQLNEQFKGIAVPIGQVFFDASQDKPWGFDIKARKYQVNNVIAHTKTGQTVVYNNLNISTDGKDYSIPIDSSQTVENFPTASFSWFNPRIYLGISGSAGVGKGTVSAEFSPSISLQVMSYGKTTTSPDLSILQIGPTYNTINKTVGVELAPINYNIGQNIPGGLITNSYLGPVLGLDVQGQFYLGAGLRVGL